MARAFARPDGQIWGALGNDVSRCFTVPRSTTHRDRSLWAESTRDNEIAGGEEAQVALSGAEWRQAKDAMGKSTPVPLVQSILVHRTCLPGTLPDICDLPCLPIALSADFQVSQRVERPA